MNEGDLDRLGELVARAKRAAGADAADAMLARSAALEASWRMGRNEGVERAEAAELGLRVFVGARQAVVSTTDLGARAKESLVERALGDGARGPRRPPLRPARRGASRGRSARARPRRRKRARVARPARPRRKPAEDAARAVSGVTNSEGAGASWRRNAVALAASNGFAGRFETTRFDLSAAVVAGADTAMERDYGLARRAPPRGPRSARKPSAARAGERAVARLGPRKGRFEPARRSSSTPASPRHGAAARQPGFRRRGRPRHELPAREARRTAVRARREHRRRPPTDPAASPRAPSTAKAPPEAR